MHEVDVLPGAFMMIKKQVLDVTGNFDERFFMYGEDIDLSYRIQQKGYQNYYLGNTVIVHFKGESTKKGSLNYVRLFYTAMSLFVKKHYRGTGAWLMRESMQGGILIRAFLSATATLFRKKSNAYKQVKQKQLKKIIVVSETGNIQTVTTIINENFTSVKVQVAAPEEIKADIFSKADEVIFCTGLFTYKKAITLLQEQAISLPVKWHGAGSKSIAGSTHKNESGEIYALDNNINAVN